MLVHMDAAARTIGRYVLKMLRIIRRTCIRPDNTIDTVGKGRVDFHKIDVWKVGSKWQNKLNICASRSELSTHLITDNAHPTSVVRRQFPA
jgi:hypothetical protein